jgi:hypothetical protein
MKYIFLFLLFTIGSCCSEDCKKVPKYFDISGFTVSLRRITAIYGNRYIYDEPLDSTTVIDYNQFLILMDPSVTYYSNNASRNHFDPSSLFVSKAYGCECASPGCGGSLERIASLRITSAYSFTSTGTPADNLSKYFDVDGQKCMEEHVNPVDLDTFLLFTPHPYQQLRLILKAKPTGSLLHKFTIEYKQTNGENYTLVTPSITFNP